MTDKAEEKILNAAIECIEEFGLNNATNRRIAEKAGVNLAAINYYFRSKDNLMEKVMETTLSNAFDWEDFDLLASKNAQEHCIAIFEDLIRGGLKYPGVSRAHFFDLLANGNYESKMMKYYSNFISHLCDDLLRRGINKPKQQLSLACSQIAYACFMAILAPRMNSDAIGINIEDPVMRHEFVSSLVNRLL